MNATVARWLRDPDFQALPAAAQQAAMERFFDERLTNDEFRRMPAAQQAGVRAAFVREHMAPAQPGQPAPGRGVLDETVSSLASGLGAVLEGVSGTAEMILPAGMGKETAGEFRQAVGRARQGDYLRRPEHLAEETVLEHPERLADWRWWVRSLGENIPNMAAMFLPGLGAVKAGKVLGLGAQAIRWLGRLGAWSGAATIEAGYAYGQAKDEMTAEGRLSNDQIETIAAMEGAAVGVVNGILEVLPFDNLVLRSSGADRVLKRIVRQAVVEGTTETAQEAVNFFVEKLGHKPDQALKDNIGRLLESGVIGAVMGGGAGLVMGPEVSEAAPEDKQVSAADAAGRAAVGGQASPAPMDETGAAPETMATRKSAQGENQRAAHKAKVRADAENMLNSVLSEIEQETEDVAGPPIPSPGGRRVAPVRTGPVSSQPPGAPSVAVEQARPQAVVSQGVRSLIGGRRVAAARTTPAASADPAVQALADADAQGLPSAPPRTEAAPARPAEISEKEIIEKEQWQMTREEFEGAADIKKYGRYGEKGISIVYPDGTREWIKKGQNRPLEILKNKIDQRYKRMLSKSYFEENQPVPLELRKPEGLAEQWEKTVDQVIDEAAERYGGNINEEVIRNNHRKFVEQAFADGKDVPAEVLADYPDLKPGQINEELSLRAAAPPVRKMPKERPAELTGEKKNLPAFIATITGKAPAPTESRTITVSNIDVKDVRSLNWSVELDVSGKQKNKKLVHGDTDWIKDLTESFIKPVDTPDGQRWVAGIRSEDGRSVVQTGPLESNDDAQAALHALEMGRGNFEVRGFKPQEKKEKLSAVSPIMGKKQTKREKSLAEYQTYIDQLSDADREQVADMIEDDPKSPGLLLTRIQKALAEAPAQEALTAEPEEPTMGITEEEVSHGEIRRPIERVPEGVHAGGLPGVGEGRGVEPVLRDQGRGGPKSERGIGERGDAGLYGRGDRDQGIVGPVEDYTIMPADRLGQGGPKQKFRDNVAAIKLLAELETRPVTPEDQSILVKYVGWGGLSQAFPRPAGSIARGWDAEVNELKALLPEDEYAAARRSTQDAHYTNEPIVRAIYTALDRIGFKAGKMLEPAVGTGNFIGLMPRAMRSRSRVTGVELDPTSAKIAGYLYPKQNIVHSGFQDLTIAPGSFDAAVGNPPFGEQKLYDPRHKELKGFSIHNYFFAKSLIGLRPNGVLAMVVSSHLMDKQGGTQRAWIAARAELMGAIRLPNNAFKGTAGTEVTTDILFLRRRGEDESAGGPAWQDLKRVQGRDSDYRVNEYFADHPEMMLGELVPNKLFPGEVVDGLYRGAPGLAADPDADFDQVLETAIERLPEGVYRAGQTVESVQRPDIIVSDAGFAQPYGYTLDDNGRAVRRLPDVNGEQVFEPVMFSGEPLAGRRLERFKGLLKIRDALRRLVRAEVADESKAQLALLRDRLNRAYDGFVKKYGLISTTANSSVLASDPTDLPLLRSLEADFDPGISKAVAKRTGETPREPSAQKAAIFRVRTREPYRPATSAKDAKEALAIVLREDGVVDMKRLAGLAGLSVEQAATDLDGIVFMDPATGLYETAEVYLSGNVKEKLAVARRSGAVDNAKALEAVIPEDVPPDLISFHVGSTWIPARVYEDFAAEVLQVPTGVSYLEDIGVWSIVPGRGTSPYDTNRMGAGDIYKRMLQSSDIAVYDYAADGSRTLNMEETTMAKAKAEEIDRAFSEWVLADLDRSDAVAREFNDKVNTTVEAKYDGSHMIFPGMGIITPGKPRDDQLLSHQKNVVWRLIQKGKGLVDHVVGSGKTFLSISAGLEMKRMGLVKKPMYAVPNHLVGQWSLDFQKLYPGANVLIVSKKDFAKSRRQEFLSRIATGDWDAVVIAHSSFGFIQMPYEYERRFYQDQVQQYERAIQELIASEGKKSRSVKQMEKAKDRLKEKMKRLADKPKDVVVDFSELGVDALFVDEAHEFKNLFYATKRTRVAGLGNPAGSKKAFDMFVKTQYILEMNNGKGVFFLTGTPVSNSISEMYTMMRYLEYERMKQMGIRHFDQWSNMFASAVTDWEVDPTGTRYRLQTKMDFVNLPGLMAFYKDFADVVSTEDLQRWAKERGQVWPIPDIKGGKPDNVVVKRSDLQESFMDWIVHRFDHMPSDPREDNPLKATGEAMKAALDIRLIDPSLPDHPGSKVNAAVDRIMGVYDRWSDRKGTQLVFCDLSVPKKSRGRHAKDIRDLKAKIRLAESRLDTAAGDAALEAEAEYTRLTDLLAKYSPAELMAAEAAFSVYDDIKAKLMAGGVPEAEIAFIHDANTEMQKDDLFSRVRTGRVRVLIGSTSKMGAGMNVQDRLVALHHLDAPWRPSDLEQREGRIVRQGNKFYKESLQGGDKFEVEIFRYATKETLDTRRWQIIERKARSIEALRAGDHQWGDKLADTVGEAANAAEMKAASSGNPLILKEIQLRKDIEQLEARQRGERARRMSYERTVRTAEAFERNYDDYVAEVRADVDLIEANPRNDSPEGWQATLNGRVFKAEGLKTAEPGAKKKEIQDVQKHNNKALKQAKADFKAGVAEVLDPLFAKKPSGKPEEVVFTVRGMDFIAVRNDTWKAVEFRPQFSGEEAYNVVGLDGTYGFLIYIKDGYSVNGLLVRMHNMIGNVEFGAPDLLRRMAVWRERYQSDVKVARKELSKKQEVAGDIEALRREHADVLNQLHTTEAQSAADKDFSQWESSAARRVVEPQYSIEPGAGELSLEDVQAVFAGQDVGVSATDPGVFWVRLKGGQGLEIRRVDRIDPDQAAIDLAYGRMDDNGALIAGKYQSGRIEIARDIGDRWTLAHESVHFLEDAGLLTVKDVGVLRRQIQRLTDAGRWETRNRDDVGGTEDRATFVADRLARRARLTGPVGRILQKVKDIIDALINLVRRTAAAVVRDIESGAVYERAVTGLGGAVLNPASYEQTAGRWYSAMERYLSEKLPGSGSVKQIKQTLTSWVKKGMIKPEELEWSGLMEWLDEQSGKVSKQNLLDFLDANRVMVEEVEKSKESPYQGDDDVEPEWSIEYYTEDNGVDQRGWYITTETNFAGPYYSEEDAESAANENFGPEYIGDTKFSKWQMPGGENYRELLLTLPDTAEQKRQKRINELANKMYSEEGLPEQEYNELKSLKSGYTPENVNYKSSHWEEPNVVAHVRFNERTGSNGERILFLEEVQSDWHQEGRKKGYANQKVKIWQVIDEIGEVAKSLDSKEGAIEYAKEYGYKVKDIKETEGFPDDTLAGSSEQLVPNAPFQKTWPLMVIKRMVRYAAENGFDQIAWTPGEVQADRYDLSKHINTLNYDEKNNILVIFSNQYPEGEDIYNVPPAKLEDYVGKEVAERILNKKEDDYGYRRLSNIDLKVGGEGMKGFYNKILPAAVNKFFNKPAWGKAKVGTVVVNEVLGGPPALTDSKMRELRQSRNERDYLKERLSVVGEEVQEVWSLPITDEMRQKALREGMPLFSIVQRQAPGPAVTQELENDRTFANKLHEMADVARENVSAASAKLQVRVQEMAGKASRKRVTVGLGYHKKVKESLASRRLDQAMFFYRDLGGDLSKIAEFRQRAQQGIADGTVKGPRKVYVGQVIKALEVAEKLSPEQIDFIDEMADRFEAAFEIARDSKVIQSHVDNYVRRIYKRKKADGDTAVYSGWSTGGHGFRVYHGAAQQRSYVTALDAILDGHELAVTGLTSAYDNYMRELVTVMANKAFIQRGSNSTDAAGRRLFTTNTNKVKGYEDYRELKAAGFSVWQLTGTISAVDERGMGGVLETNSWGRKVFITKPEHVPRSWAVYKPGGLRPSRVFYDNPLYDAQAAARDWADGKGYDDIRERPPKEVADQFQKLKLYAPANIADMINKMTATDPLFSQTPGLKAVARLNAGVKSWVLMTSFFHHLAGARSWVFGVHHGWGRGKHMVVSKDGSKVLGEFRDLEEARGFAKGHEGAMVVERSKAAPWRSYKAGLDKVYDLHPLISMGVKNGLTLGELQDWSESALRADGGLTERLVKHFGWERAASVVERFRFTRERWTNSLFKKYFAGLKAEAFVVEFTHELSRAQEKHAAGQGPAVNADKVAERVARLINADFGGLHLKRMGRNPTMQLFSRLLLLAPDWTESNFRTVSGMIPGLNERINKLVGDVPPPPGMDDIYRRFWGRVMVRIAVSTIVAQLLLNGKDETDDFLQEQMFFNRFNRFRWTEIDISRLYEMMGIDLEGQRKTFSLGGHFFDPLKLIDPWRLIKGKASPAMRALGAGLSGSDWAERPFTGVRELVTTGRTVKGSAYEKKEAGLNRLPSTVINQVINMQPIQMGQLMRYFQGEEDGLTALARSVGAHVHTAWVPRAEEPVEDVPGYGDIFTEIRRLKTAGVLRMGPPDRRVTIGGVPAKMTAAQYDAYLRGSSEAAMRRLKSLLNSAGYKTWNDARRAAKVKAVIKNARARDRKKVKRRMRKAA